MIDGVVQPTLAERAEANRIPVQAPAAPATDGFDQEGSPIVLPSGSPHAEGSRGGEGDERQSHKQMYNSLVETFNPFMSLMATPKRYDTAIAVGKHLLGVAQGVSKISGSLVEGLFSDPEYNRQGLAPGGQLTTNLAKDQHHAKKRRRCCCALCGSDDHNRRRCKTLEAMGFEAISRTTWDRDEPSVELPEGTVLSQPTVAHKMFVRDAIGLLGGAAVVQGQYFSIDAKGVVGPTVVLERSSVTRIFMATEGCAVLRKVM